MAAQIPLVIGTTVPIQQLPAGDTLTAPVTVSAPNVLLGRLTAGEGGHEEIDPDALTEETAPAAGDFVPIWTDDGLRKVEFGEFGGGGGGASYAVYTALLSQSDTDDPVATVLENTLGGAIVWTRDSQGAYLGTLSSAFTSSKTFLSCGSLVSNDDPGNIPIAQFWRLDASNVKLITYMNNSSNDYWDACIEIRVYP